MDPLKEMDQILSKGTNITLAEITRFGDILERVREDLVEKSKRMNKLKKQVHAKCNHTFVTEHPKCFESWKVCTKCGFSTDIVCRK